MNTQKPPKLTTNKTKRKTPINSVIILDQEKILHKLNNNSKDFKNTYIVFIGLYCLKKNKHKKKSN